MIISCPKCSAGFYVLPAQIGTTGRRVKCSKCRNIWHASIPGHAIVKEDIIVQKTIISNSITGANLPTVIPIEISIMLYCLPFMLLGLILSTIWILYPDFTDKIGVCGSMCAGKNMRVENVIYELQESSNTLNVKYNITNAGSVAAVLPLVHIFVTDKHNVKLYSYVADPNAKGNISIKPGKSISAKTAFANMSPEAKFLNIELGSSVKFLFR
ncbi:MAG: zinc-ribbon domain-containing protein [Rickettsiaceae bacterium]|nr:zinc-ribbon domain-containing protein [Rickettsiaceae bacterium]